MRFLSPLKTPKLVPLLPDTPAPLPEGGFKGKWIWATSRILGHADSQTGPGRRVGVPARRSGPTRPLPFLKHSPRVQVSVSLLEGSSLVGTAPLNCLLQLSWPYPLHSHSTSAPLGNHHILLCHLGAGFFQLGCDLPGGGLCLPRMMKQVDSGAQGGGWGISKRFQCSSSPGQLRLPGTLLQIPQVQL